MFNITNLILEDKLLEFLRFANNDFTISQIITQGSIGMHLKDEGNYISIVPGEYDTISYLPKSKMDKEEDVWNKNRVKIKIGRFIKKFFTEFSLKEFKIDDSAIEKFVNVYKSYFSEDGKNLKIVQGPDIQKYYLEDNYYRESGYANGTLWNSCMRQRERNKFMELYTVNSNIKMLVLFSDDGKVKARAILWESGVFDEDGKEWKVMDRVYSFFDHQVDIFKKWADENGYIYKWRQDAKSEGYFLINGKRTRLNLSVVLENSNFETYPYLDTFKFYNVKERRFSNNDYKFFDYMLTSSRGYLPQDEDESDDDNDLTFTFNDDLWNDIPIEYNNQSNEVPRLRPVRLPRIERGTERRITESDGLNSIDIERIINELGGSLDSIIRRPEDNQENNEINPF